MQQIKSVNKLYGSDKIFRTLLKIAIPAAITTSITSSLLFVSLFFMNYYIKNTPTGNVMSIITPLNILLSSLSWIATLGASTKFLYFFGKKDMESVKKNASTACFSACIIALFGALFLFIIARPVILILSHHDQLITSYALDYFRYLLIGYPFMVVSFFFGFMFRNGGQLYVSLSVFIFCIVIQILSIFFLLNFVHTSDAHLKYNLIGIGASIGNFLTMIYVVFVYMINTRTARSIFIMEWKYFRFIKGTTIPLLKIGLGPFFQNMGNFFIGVMTNLALAYVVISHLSYRIGPFAGSNIHKVTNAQYWQFLFGTTWAIWVFLTNPIYGINASSRQMSAYSCGRCDIKRLRRIRKMAIIVNASYLILMELILIIFGHQLLHAFGVDNGLVKEYSGHKYVLKHIQDDCWKTICIEGSFFWVFCIQGINTTAAQIQFNAKYAIIAALLRPVIIEFFGIIIATVISASLHNPWYFWCSYPAMDIIALCLGIWLQIHLWKKLIIYINNKIKNEKH